MALPIKIQEVTPARRTIRRPQHPFQVRFRPWQITPFFIAPVLPGETMRNLVCQAQYVSDPVKSKLVGWWLEKYFFYCKLSDLSGRNDFTAMMTDPTVDVDADYASAALTELMHPATSISWVNECLERVTSYYFRFNGEAWDGHKIGNLPSASIMQKSVWDSAILDSERAVIADVNVDLNADGTTTVAEVDKAFYTWQMLRTQGMTNATYEDFLAAYGVRPTPEELHKPELVRYVRDWSYPTNHVDPSNGTPSSALVWKMSERADKDRFFREPGFLFGVVVARPKVYLSKQLGTVTDVMNDLYAWLPPMLRDNPEASMRKIAAHSGKIFGGNGSSTGNSAALWIDLKDLFEYGEQFVNFDLAATDAGMVALPNAALTNKRYASATDADALFASASPANQVRGDGIVSLAVATTTVDTSQPV